MVLNFISCVFMVAVSYSSCLFSAPLLFFSILSTLLYFLTTISIYPPFYSIFLLFFLPPHYLPPPFTPSLPSHHLIPPPFLHPTLSGNLLVTRDCRLRIADFGLARERPTGKGVDPDEEIDGESRGRGGGEKMECRKVYKEK